MNRPVDIIENPKFGPRVIDKREHFIDVGWLVQRWQDVQFFLLQSPNICHLSGQCIPGYIWAYSVSGKAPELHTHRYALWDPAGSSLEITGIGLGEVSLLVYVGAPLCFRLVTPCASYVRLLMASRKPHNCQVHLQPHQTKQAAHFLCTLKSF